jgi:hypothetical protein
VDLEAQESSILAPLSFFAVSTLAACARHCLAAGPLVFILALARGSVRRLSRTPLLLTCGSGKVRPPFAVTACRSAELDPGECPEIRCMQ